MQKICLMGAYPPPIGGNSVHIQRLKKLIDTHFQCDCKVLDMYSSNGEGQVKDVVRIGPPGISSILKALLFLMRYKPDIIHVHVSAMGKFLYVGLFLLFFVPKKTNKIITIHSGSFVRKCQLYSKLKMFFTKYLLKKFTNIITVNEEQKQFLIDQDIKAEIITVMPAYIPSEPVYSEELDDLLTELNKSFDRVIVTSGYGVPLYGYDKIIPLINDQADFDQTIALIICTYNTYDDEYMDKVYSQIKDNRSVVVLRNLSPEKFAYILQSSDIYIRATDRDGDAVAIREARYFNLPVLASDVVKRPEYCHLFDLNSEISLKESLQEVLSNKTYDFGNTEEDSIIDKIKDVYVI